MATISREPKNRFNFLRLYRVTNGTLSDLPITDQDPIGLIPDDESDWVVSTGFWLNEGKFWRNDKFWIDNP